MKPIFKPSKLAQSHVLPVLLASLLTACGGGGSSDTPAAAANAVPPVIATQPSQQAAVAGASVTFSVAATGEGLTYQWQTSTNAGTSWSDVSGATTASYTLTASAALSGSLYRVVVQSAGLAVTSSPVALAVTAAVAAPAITADAASITVPVGSDAVFSVTATGTQLAYQWQTSTDGTNFVNVAGATAATLTLTSATAADSGKLVRVVVTNSAGVATGRAVALTVTAASAAAAIVSQPAGASVVAPAQATFTVIATGSPAPTFQWQKSIDGGATYADIAGATGASYTSPATAVADDAGLFRVSVTNSGATIVSAPASLSVTAAPVAVSIATQPASTSVTVPSGATFSVVASGTPTPTYQWQVKAADASAAFTNITGATSDSYTTPATAAADNGKQYRVVVTNGSGAVTSAVATLSATAAAAPSLLTGRAWTVGQSLETGDTSVTSQSLGIDDTGNAISVFVKSDGTRNVLYASRMVPGAAGVPPVWSAPVAIDTAAAPAGGSNAAGARVLTVAPNGNAAVSWVATAPCTSSTYNTALTSTCNYLYTARYNATSNAWAAPVQMADTPDGTPALEQRLDSSGDLAMLYPGWERSGTNSYTARPAVLWQAAAQSTVQKRVFNDTKLNHYDLQMDKAGNMVLAGDASQNATTDIVAYRGTMAAGFGAQEVLDERTAAATYQALAVGLNGQVIVMWQQNNGTINTRITADLTTPTAAWRVKEVEPYANTGNFTSNGLIVTDAGEGRYTEYSNGSCTSYFHRFSGGVWSALQRFPSGFPDCNVSSVTSNRNGDLLLLEGSGWSTYDAGTNSLIRLNTATAPSVYGTSGGSLGTSSKALSISGIGVLTTAVPYDILPTPATPAGDGRSAVLNLWGLVLK